MIRMIQREALLVAALGACALSCGGGAKCSVSFSGAFSGTYACTAGGSYNTSANTAIVNVAVLPTGSLQSFDFGLTMPGDLRTGTWTSTSSTTTTVLLTSLRLANGQSFTQNSGGQTGSATVAVGSVGTLATNSGGRVYTIHGSLDGTVLASSGTSSQVVVHASF